MNNLYGVLKDHFISDKIKPEMYNIPYFSEYLRTISDEEMYVILKYPTNKFRDYVNFMYALTMQGKVVDCSLVHELGKILYDSQYDNIDELKSLLLKTDIMHNSNVLKFARSYINIAEPRKAKFIYEVIRYNNRFAREPKTLMQLVTYAGYIKKEEQLDALEKLLVIPSISKHKDFNSFINLILNNPNCKFLTAIPKLLSKSYVYNSNDALQLVSLFVKVKDVRVANLIYKVINNKELFGSNAFERTINFILNKRNKKKLSHLEYVISRKNYLNDSRFTDFLDLYASTDIMYQLDAITDLVDNKKAYTFNAKNENDYNLHGVLSDYQFELITKYILKTKAPFQATELVHLPSSINLRELDNQIILDYLNNLIETRYDFQAHAMSSLLKIVNSNKYLYQRYMVSPSEYTTNNLKNFSKLPEAMKTILQIEDENACLKVLDVLTLPCLLERDDFSYFMNKYVKLNKMSKINTFIKILAKQRFVDCNNFVPLDCIVYCDDYKLELLEKIIMETTIYRNKEKCELIKTLLATDNRYVLNYITAILLNINFISVDDAKNMIKEAIENPSLVNNIAKNNFEKRMYTIDVIYAYEELNKNLRVIDKVGKVLTKKKKN